MTDIPEVMTTAEAAKALRCSTATIRRKLKSKELEGSVDMGRVTVRSVMWLLNITPLKTLSECRAAVETLIDLESRIAPATPPSTPAESDDDAT